jgi:4-hydroxybenzoyl-CoA thioesterase
MLSNSYKRTIEWGDCDPAGIVFNPQFFRFFDHGTALLYSAAGWPKPRMLQEFNAVGCPLVSTEAAFHSPCRYGDEVEITTSIIELGKSSFKIEHKLYQSERLCVTGTEVRVWVIRDPETGKLKGEPIPDEVRTAFAS